MNYVYVFFLMERLPPKYKRTDTRFPSATLFRSLPLGAPDGCRSDRVIRLSEALTEAGIDAPVLDNIRQDIWTKLWGNLSFNPVSVLTHGTLGGLASDPDAQAVVGAMMAEAQQIGEALGIHFPMTDRKSTRLKPRH